MLKALINSDFATMITVLGVLLFILALIAAGDYHGKFPPKGLL